MGTCGPETGVDVREDAVALLDGGEAVFLFCGEGIGGLTGQPDLCEFVELVVVGVEAELGVIARGAGGDEELPVGGFEQKEFPAELLDDALAQGGSAPVPRGADLAGEEFGGVDVGVGPGGVRVHPDVVRSFGSPGALVHGDGVGGAEPIEIGGAVDEVDDAGLSV